ncbi:MAG: hypothetical protein ACI9ZX_000500, partial [Algoriphagus sp.]
MYSQMPLRKLDLGNNGMKLILLRNKKSETSQSRFLQLV